MIMRIIKFNLLPLPRLKLGEFLYLGPNTLHPKFSAVEIISKTRLEEDFWKCYEK